MQLKNPASLAFWAACSAAIVPAPALAQNIAMAPAAARPAPAGHNGAARTPRLLPAASPGLQCRQAIQAAERSSGVPSQLMAAIGRVESGRADAQGVIHPWPWTINAEGAGQYFETKDAALAAVRALQASGVRSIDVGCMQVNLHYHPTAFSSLEQAFDPATNAAYAARYLNELYATTRDWGRATAFYHSATPERGENYQRRVAAALPQEHRRLILTPLAGHVWSQHAFSDNAWNSTGRARTGILANSGRPLTNRRPIVVPGTGNRL